MQFDDMRLIKLLLHVQYITRSNGVYTNNIDPLRMYTLKIQLF